MRRMMSGAVVTLLCCVVPGIAQYTAVDAFPNLSFASPVGLYTAGDNSNRIFVLGQGGTIRVFPNSPAETGTSLFLDLTDSIVSGGELGLLGLAFHPQYTSNRYFYVDYTRDNPLRTVISRFQASASNPDSAIRGSEVVLLTIAQPYTNHNGGQLTFGPDGYLYIGMGDGGSAGDPQNNAQNKSVLLGKILRINVDSAAGGKQYAIPPTNPFAGNVAGYREEIYAYGLRNPWRFSFDTAGGGTLLAADVGQSSWEEIDTVRNGANLGWNLLEGTHCYNSCDTTGTDLPIFEYGHLSGRCSITGGFVCRAASLPSLAGRYIYGDYCTGEIWSLDRHAPGGPANTFLLNSGTNISSFGLDEAGELYFCASSAGRIYRLAQTLPPPPPAPALLVPASGASNQLTLLDLRWAAAPSADTYELQAGTDSLFGAVVRDDSLIADTVRQISGLSVSTTYFWRVRGRNVSGYGPYSPARSFTTGNAATFAIPVRRGWNLISLPVSPADPRLNVLFPTAVSPAFAYTPANGYTQSDSLLSGRGYWLKFGDNQLVGLAGSPIQTDTIALKAGWNLLGTIASAVPVGLITQSPPGNVLSAYFAYDGGYPESDTLTPGTGYWVKAGAEGTLILTSAGLMSQTHTGEATFYTFADGSGNCMFDPTPNDLLVGAMNQTEYANSAICGACVAVTGPLGATNIRIVDRCPECAPGDIDLSPLAFSMIADTSLGRVPISWHLRPCDVTGPIAYHFKDGSNQWWTAVQIRNHRNPIAQLEYMVSPGVFKLVNRVEYNYFVEPSGMGPGPYTFRVTDIFGNTIVDTGIIPVADTTIPGSAQFP